MKRIFLAAIIALIAISTSHASIRSWQTLNKTLRIGTSVEITYIKQNGNIATIKGRILSNDDQAISVGFFPIRFKAISHESIIGLAIVNHVTLPESMMLELLNGGDGKVTFFKYGTSDSSPPTPSRRWKLPSTFKSSNKIEIFDNVPDANSYQNFSGYRPKKKRFFGLF